MLFSDYETTTLPPITTMRPELGAAGCLHNDVFYKDGDQVRADDDPVLFASPSGLHWQDETHSHTSCQTRTRVMIPYVHRRVPYHIQTP